MKQSGIANPKYETVKFKIQKLVFVILIKKEVRI